MAEFKAKNLTYEKSQPAFLQRLRAEYSGDRNNVQFARPSKSRMKIGDVGEDEPTIVNESGEGVSKEEYEEMLRRETSGGEGGGKEGEVAEVDGKGSVEDLGRDDEVREKQKVVEAGAGKKRKVGRVVGETDVVDGAGMTKDISGGSELQGDKKKPASEHKPKKKTKKIKLSFDEPGD